MKNTALQQHIAWLKKKLAECGSMAPAIPFITISINHATELLEIEKQQIIDAYKSGSRDHIYDQFNNKYFTQTYKSE